MKQEPTNIINDVILQEGAMRISCHHDVRNLIVDDAYQFNAGRYEALVECQRCMAVTFVPINRRQYQNLTFLFELARR